MPCHAGDFDVTSCSAYKWLCHPRGTAYLTVRPEVWDRLRPVHAGWYAGESRWDAVYGPQMLLAADARRFDVSPAWLAWAGAVPAMELFAGLDPEQVRAYDAGLADALLDRLGLEPQGRAVVSLPDPCGELAAALAERGAVVAGRAGRVRIGFHLWNDEEDVDLCADVLVRATRRLSGSQRADRRSAHTGRMQESEAARIADALRAYGLIASVARPSAFRFGVRVPLGDGREALWDVDGAAGLEAQIMRDGVLVGFVPQIEGSESFDEAMTARAIATADYGTAGT
jgi:kynureninase